MPHFHKSKDPDPLPTAKSIRRGDWTGKMSDRTEIGTVLTVKTY